MGIPNTGLQISHTQGWTLQALRFLPWNSNSVTFISLYLGLNRVSHRFSKWGHQRQKRLEEVQSSSCHTPDGPFQDLGGHFRVKLGREDPMRIHWNLLWKHCGSCFRLCLGSCGAPSPSTSSFHPINSAETTLARTSAPSSPGSIIPGVFCSAQGRGEMHTVCRAPCFGVSSS